MPLCVGEVSARRRQHRRPQAAAFRASEASEAYGFINYKKMINDKIQKLANAITIAEGWIPEIASLSFRNHNPGNLKSSPFALGTHDGFAYFLNDSVGFFSLMWDLAKKCRGETRTKLNGQATLEELVRVFSAETEPIKLSSYLSIVIRVTGKGRNTKLEYFTT